MIEAIITGAVAIIVCMINNAVQSHNASKKHEETISLIEYKLEQLTHKVDLHNNAVVRLYKVEQDLEVHEERIKVANHRIDDLEHERKAGA